jgi:hypothetical protein
MSQAEQVRSETRAQLKRIEGWAPRLQAAKIRRLKIKVDLEFGLESYKHVDRLQHRLAPLKQG